MEIGERSVWPFSSECVVFGLHNCGVFQQFESVPPELQAMLFERVNAAVLNQRQFVVTLKRPAGGIVAQAAAISGLRLHPHLAHATQTTHTKIA